MNNYGFGAGLNNSFITNPVVTGARYGTDFESMINQAGQGDSSMSWNQNTWLNNMIQLANNGDVAAQEKLFNFYAQLLGDQRTYQREDTAYQRLVEDMKKAGISPYILSGATPFASNSSLQSYSGSQMVSQQSNKISSLTSRQNKEAEISKGLLIGILAFVGLIAKAII